MWYDDLIDYAADHPVAFFAAMTLFGGAGGVLSHVVVDVLVGW